MSRASVRGTVVASLGLAALLLAGGAAEAFWGGSATGSGAAGSGTNVAVVLSPGSPATSLVPGATADVVLTVSNPNASRLRIGSLSLDTGQGTGGYTVDGGHSGCSLSALSFTNQSNGGAGWTVPGKVGAVDGTLSVTLAGAVAMDTAADNACQGASFDVYLAAGP